MLAGMHKLTMFYKQWRRGLKKYKGGEGSWNVPTHGCKFPTEKITGAQNFKFAHKFGKNEEFPTEFLYF